MVLGCTAVFAGHGTAAPPFHGPLFLLQEVKLRFMQATAKTAMRRALGIRGGQGETLVPPTAVAGGDEGFVFEFEASDNNNSG